DGEFAPALHNRGSIYNDLNQTDKALADFDKAIALDAKDALAWYNRGIVFNKLNQADKALPAFSEAIALNLPPQWSAPAYLPRAQAHGRLAHFEEARTDYQAAVKCAPDDHEAHNALAWLLATCPDAKLRDPDQAVESAKKAAELVPKNGLY